MLIRFYADFEDELSTVLENGTQIYSAMERKPLLLLLFCVCALVLFSVIGLTKISDSCQFLV